MTLKTIERANTDIWMHLDKVIPISHLKDFSVHHMPNKYINIIGTYEPFTYKK